MPIVTLEMICDLTKHLRGLNIPATLENAVHLYGMYTILDPLEKAIAAAQKAQAEKPAPTDEKTEEKKA